MDARRQPYHLNSILGRDVGSEKILLDRRGFYTQEFFPWSPDTSPDLTTKVTPAFTRTQKPLRYYIIDFGFSKQYAPEEMSLSEPPLQGSDRTAPEFLDETSLPIPSRLTSIPWGI